MSAVLLPIRAQRALVWLVVAVGGLTAAGVAVQVFKYAFGRDWLMGFSRLLDLNGEANLPAWCASTALLLSGLMALAIAADERMHEARFRRHWRGLAALFVFMSMDEAAQIHEMSAIPVRETFGFDGWLHFSWVVLGAALAVIVGVAFLRFVLHLPRHTSSVLVVSAGLLLGGAIGVEMIGGVFAAAWGEHNLTFQLISAFEEFLELSGAALPIYALLDYGERRLATAARDETADSAAVSPDVISLRDARRARRQKRPPATDEAPPDRSERHEAA